MTTATLQRKTTSHFADAQPLLTHLWRGGTWAYWWTPDGPEYFSKKQQKDVRAKLSLWFPLKRTFAAVPGAWHDKNVYFGVHPATQAGERWQRSHITTVAAVNCVFAEFDGEDYAGGKTGIRTHLETLPIFPTCIIDSGGGLHAYWLLDEPQLVTPDNLVYLKRCQTAWVDLVGGDGGAKDLARVLRLPGWQNHKPERGPDFPTVKIMYLDLQRIYPFERIADLVAERIAAEEEAHRQRVAINAARTGEIAPGAGEILLEGCIRKAQTGSRHNLALWLAYKLKEEGFAQWVALRILEEFARRVSVPTARTLDTDEMERIARYVWGDA